MIHHPTTAGRTCCSMHVLLAPLCTYNATYHSVITMAPWGNNWTKAGCIWECLHLLQWPWPIPWGSAALARGLGQGEHWARACGFTGYWSKEIFWVEALWPMWWLPCQASLSIGPSTGWNCRRWYCWTNLTGGILDTLCCRGRWQYMVKWAWESDVVGLCHNIIIMPEQLHHHHAATIRCPKCQARVAQRWSLPPPSTPWPSNTIQDLTRRKLPLTTGSNCPAM